MKPEEDMTQVIEQIAQVAVWAFEGKASQDEINLFVKECAATQKLSPQIIDAIYQRYLELINETGSALASKMSAD